MSKEDQKSDPLITLKLDIGERSFYDLDDLREWRNEEINSFRWLTNTSKGDTNAVAGWNKISGWIGEIDKFIKLYSQDKQKQQHLINTLITQTNDSVVQAHIITSKSPDAQFIFKLRDRTSPVTAAYALNYIMKVENINFNSHHALEGAFAAFQYLSGNSETVESIRISLEDLRREWSGKFTTQHSNQREISIKQINEFENFKSTFSSIQSDIDKEKNNQSEGFNVIIDESKERLENLERTFFNKIATEASVKYWTDKKNHHEKMTETTGKATLWTAIITGLAFLIIAFLILDETLTNVPLWKLGIVFAISTFGIWLTRLAAKIFISNLHLRTDADERVTMIQTYLALLQEGNGPKDDERQLILQTLFRPSNSGFIKEDGNAGLYESMVKLFQQR